MTYRECVIVSAYTGYLMCDFDDMHKYIEEKMNRTVWTHEMANKEMQGKIRTAVKSDFLALCQHNTQKEDEPNG